MAINATGVNSHILGNMEYIQLVDIKPCRDYKGVLVFVMKG